MRLVELPAERRRIGPLFRAIPRSMKLDANECGPSVVGPPNDAGADLSLYPDRSELESIIAARAGVDPARIVATAGADDAIDRTFGMVLEPGSTVVTTDPTFPMFSRFAAERGASVRSVPWSSGPLPVAELASAARDAAAIVIATPNNPNGAVASAAEIATLRATAPDPLLMLDLAYAEFDALEPVGPAEPALAAWCRWMPRTVLLRTLSKAWGLASLRVGWLETETALAAAIRDRGGPYPVSGLSLGVAAEALRDPRVDEAVRERVSSVGRNRDRLVAAAADLGIDVDPSRGNFVLVRPGDDERDAGRLRAGLRGLGIEVRGFPGTSIADRIRITVPAASRDVESLTTAISTVLRPDGIVLDLDGVLADVSSSYRAAIRETAATYSVTVDIPDIEAVKAAGDANDDWVVTERLLRAAGVRPDPDEMIARFQACYLGIGDRPGLRERERPLVDRDEIATALEGLPVAVVTGRPRDEAQWFLARFGLEAMVDVIVAREDAPLKPDPRGLESALDRLGIRTAWFLGDTEDDVVAARRVQGRRVLPIGVVPAGCVDPLGVRDRLLEAGAGWVVDSGRACVASIRRARP